MGLVGPSLKTLALGITNSELPFFSNVRFLIKIFMGHYRKYRRIQTAPFFHFSAVTTADTVSSSGDNGRHGKVGLAGEPGGRMAACQPTAAVQEGMGPEVKRQV